MRGDEDKDIVEEHEGVAYSHPTYGNLIEDASRLYDSKRIAMSSEQALKEVEKTFGREIMLAVKAYLLRRMDVQRGGTRGIRAIKNRSKQEIVDWEGSL